MSSTFQEVQAGYMSEYIEAGRIQDNTCKQEKKMLLQMRFYRANKSNHKNKCHFKMLIPWNHKNVTVSCSTSKQVECKSYFYVPQEYSVESLSIQFLSYSFSLPLAKGKTKNTFFCKCIY